MYSQGHGFELKGDLYSYFSGCFCILKIQDDSLHTVVNGKWRGRGFKRVEACEARSGAEGEGDGGKESGMDQLPQGPDDLRICGTKTRYMCSEQSAH